MKACTLVVAYVAHYCILEPAVMIGVIRQAIAFGMSRAHMFHRCIELCEARGESLYALIRSRNEAFSYMYSRQFTKGLVYDQFRTQSNEYAVYHEEVGLYSSI